MTPDGRVVMTLKHGKHTYNELRLETGLSDRWLTVKLKELVSEGVVEKSGRWYGLTGKPAVSAYELALYMRTQAKRMASELADLRFIRAIVLFGSVARKKAHEYSDLDMMIIVDEPVDKARKEVASEISILESKYHMTVEPLILSGGDFVENIQSEEGGIIYGLAEGFEVLFDRTGETAETLSERVEEVKQGHDYLEEVRIWLKAK